MKRLLLCCTLVLVSGSSAMEYRRKTLNPLNEPSFLERLKGWWSGTAAVISPSSDRTHFVDQFIETHVKPNTSGVIKLDEKFLNDLVDATSKTPWLSSYFLEQLNNYPEIKTLDLSGNVKAFWGVKTIIESLPRNKTITSLVLRKVGASVLLEAIATTLKQNNILKALDLSYNFLTDESAQFLAKMLEDNTTLETLDVSHNAITNIGAQALVEMLSSNKTLTDFDISGNYIDSSEDDLAKKIEELINNNKQLKTAK